MMKPVKSLSSSGDHCLFSKRENKARRRAGDEPVSDLMRALLAGSTEAVKSYHAVVAKALAYLAEHLQEQMTLQELAAHAGVSPSHLIRLFREEIGVSPMKFLTVLRVEKSKQVLTDRWHTVGEAWEASGFGDLRTFEREFKRWVGCTPKEYQKRASQKAQKPEL